jgi:hypothetical protein
LLKVDFPLALLLLLALFLIQFFGAADEVPVPTPALTAPPPATPTGRPGITLVEGGFVYEDELVNEVARMPPDQRNGTLYVRIGQTHLTPLAPDLKGNLHFVNGYLVGYVPDATVAPWVPLYTLASRKTYQTDLDQYRFEERWQNSYEALHNERGDCEDHALALADWLIGLGLDARVVLGKAKGEGHAWVVVNDGDRSFLLEATDKQRIRRWAYPLAQLHPEYVASDMFNRQDWWKNLGSPAGDYQSPRWQRLSRYNPGT